MDRTYVFNSDGGAGGGSRIDINQTNLRKPLRHGLQSESAAAGKKIQQLQF